MKTIRFQLNRVTYTIDLPVVILFLMVCLDIVSTSLFVILQIGAEANLILKGLIPISILFIPVYLFSTNALFIPFLPDLLRKTFCYTFGLVSFLFALNNFSLILFRNAFLVDTFGFNTLLLLYFIFGITLFIYLGKKEGLDRKDMMRKGLWLLFFVLFIGLLHLLFYLLTLIL